MDIEDIGHEIKTERRRRHLSQKALAQKAKVSRATLEALENSRGPDIGLKKVRRILHILDLDLVVSRHTRQRPTLDTLMQEEEEEDLDRATRPHRP